MSNLPGEEWRDVEGFNGWYQVSNLGRFRKTEIVAPDSAGKKYTFVQLPLHEGVPKLGSRSRRVGLESRRQRVLVHRLVANAFLGRCPIAKEVNHRDGNGHNNRLDNLEYVTRSENVKHAWAIGLRRPEYGQEAPNSRLMDWQRAEIVAAYACHAATQRWLASRFGVSQTTIRRILGKRKD